MTVLVRLTAGCERGQRPRPGQAMIFLALVFVVLMGSLGLALDGGYNFAQRRAMQNAADAAALAGAQAVSVRRSDVLEVVRAVAIQNGVQDADHVECTWINNALPSDPLFSTLGSCTNTLPASNVAGVRVTVTEEHPTFVMGVLGIRTASTSATATAQIQIVDTFTPGPFTICGMDTAKETNPNGSTGGILKGSGTYFATKDPTATPPDYTRLDTMAGCGAAGKERCEKTKEKDDNDKGPPQINDDIYYYDWKMTDAAGNPIDPLTNPIPYSGGKYGPTFRLYSSGSGPNDAVAVCNLGSANFKGINLDFASIKLKYGDWGPPYVTSSAPYTPHSDATTTGFTNGAAVNAIVNSSVIGVGGCAAGQVPNNCIVLVPVIDSSGKGGSGNCSGCIAVRKVVAIYVMHQKGGGPEKFLGRLIKNYPTVGPSTGGYTSDTDAPIMIRLIQ